jgi:heme-degrading monooxygenase HmoA
MAHYTYVWEFHVEPGRQREFEREYGPDGAWVALFRQAAGYIETLLLRDRANPVRYVTVDRWDSVEAYRAFRAKFSAEYAALDARCSGLTRHERALGEFFG